MRTGFAMFACLGILTAIGCSEQTATSSGNAEHSHEHDHHGEPGTIQAPVAPSAEGVPYVLDEMPNDPQNIIAARESAEDDADVVLAGRIGGSHNPWIEGQAIFTLVDESLDSCNQIPGDTCPAPWDYCCETDKLPNATALVKVVDDSGQPIRTDARELLGVRELTEVVVQGKAKRDDAGNLTVHASRVFVKK